MKKVLSIVLAVVIACSVCFTVLAVQEPIIEVKSNVTSANVGDVVTISVELAENSNLGVLSFNLIYDVDSLECAGDFIIDEDIFPMYEAYSFKDTGAVTYVGITSGTVSKGGSVLTLDFKVLKPDATIILDVVEVCDSDDIDITDKVAAEAVSSVTIFCGHAHKSVVVTKDATCSETGIKVTSCEDCGLVLDTEDIPVVSHSFGDATVVKAPTCTEEGELSAVCSVCGERVVETIPVTGHKFGDWVVSKEATCQEQGEVKRICATCGEEESRATEVAAHTLGEWVVVKEVTCVDNGVKESICTVCGERFTEDIEFEGHKLGEVTVVKAPTCTEDGQSSAVCSVCGHTVSEVISSTGHSFSEWVIIKGATGTEEGYMERVCKTCGEVETKIINKDGSIREPETGGVIVEDPHIPQTDAYIR